MAGRKPIPPPTPKECPVCGEDVPRGALACPGGNAERITTRAGERRRGSTTAGGSLPEAEFDYEEFVRQEFNSGPKPSAMKLGWWITAILVVVIFLRGLVLCRIPMKEHPTVRRSFEDHLDVAIEGSNLTDVRGS